MSANGKLVLITAALFLFTVFSPMAFNGHGGDASAWTDGNRDSPVMPNYGIQDMIADKAFKLLENRSLEKAEFIRFWFDQAGANGDPDSFDPDHVYPLPDDNFLAWTDDGPEGVTVDYFINNPEPGQDPQTDAVQYAQMLANRSVENLTKWMLEGKGTEEKGDIQFMHSAAYNAGKLSKYIGDMSQYGHTDYTKWDQLSVVPTYHPSEVDYPYREYYEARVWSDTSMETLYGEFWDNRTYHATVLARTIEFTEKNILPTGQPEHALNQRDGFRRAHQPRFQMGIAIPIHGIVHPNTSGDYFLQERHHIGLDALIPVLLNHDRRGCALGIHRDQPIANAAAAYDSLHLQRDVNQDFAFVRTQMNQFLHAKFPNRSLPPPSKPMQPRVQNGPASRRYSSAATFSKTNLPVE